MKSLLITDSGVYEIKKLHVTGGRNDNGKPLYEAQVSFKQKELKPVKLKASDVFKY